MRGHTGEFDIFVLFKDSGKFQILSIPIFMMRKFKVFSVSGENFKFSSPSLTFSAHENGKIKFEIFIVLLNYL